MKYVFYSICGFLIVNIFFILPAKAQTECSGSQALTEKRCAGDEISGDERELFRIINEYRVQNGLPPVQLSNSLSLVANRHLIDLEKNVRYLTHGWSDCPYDLKDKNTWNCVFAAPQRLGTDYTGRGYENLYRNLNRKATPTLALDAWKKSLIHNALLLNLDSFKDDIYDACGIAVRGNYAALWYGTKGGTPVKNNQVGGTLGVSFEEATRDLSQVLSISKVSSTVESNKWTGASADKSITLEIFGNPKDISEAAMTFRVKFDKSNLSEKNKSVLFQFLDNLVSGGGDTKKWVESSLEDIAQDPTAFQTLTVNGKTIDLRLDAKNFLTLAVKPAKN